MVRDEVTKQHTKHTVNEKHGYSSTLLVIFLRFFYRDDSICYGAAFQLCLDYTQYTMCSWLNRWVAEAMGVKFLAQGNNNSRMLQVFYSFFVTAATLKWLCGIFPIIKFDLLWHCKWLLVAIYVIILKLTKAGSVSLAISCSLWQPGSYLKSKIPSCGRVANSLIKQKAIWSRDASEILKILQKSKPA